MGYPLLQSQTAQPLTFLLVLTSDHLSGATGKTPTVTLSKNGAAFASPAGAVTEIGNGWYQVAGNATDANTLGPLLLHATATGCDAVDDCFPVIAYDPQSATSLGLSRLDTTVGSRSTLTQTQVTGGAYTLNTDGSGNIKVSSGTGANQVSLASGAVTVGTNNDKTGYGLSAAAVQAIWDALTSALTTVGSIGKLLVDNLNSTVSGVAAAVWAMGARTITGGTIGTYTGNTPQTGDVFAQLPVRFSSLNIDTSGRVTTTYGLHKNTALANFEFPMVDGADHVTLITGRTVTGTVSIDGAAFMALTNAVVEVGSGIYKVNLAAADLNGTDITLRFTATGADPTVIGMVLQG